jgi:hypothetical protein
MVPILLSLYIVRVQGKLIDASIYIFLDVLNAKHNYDDCKSEILEIIYAEITFVICYNFQKDSLNI